MTNPSPSFYRRRATDAPFWWKLWEFNLAPIVDHYEGISITRLLAIYFAILDGVSVILSATHAITLNHLWLALAALSTAFGKSTFTFLLKKMQYSGTATQDDRTVDERKTVNVKIEETKRLIESKRDDDTGEPLPDAPGQEVTASR